MNTVRGARARARVEVTAAIKDEARRQLAAEGAAKLSLRAVARELGMVSSALYRYFPSRDDLLTALIVDAYDAIGAAAEAALADVDAGAGRGAGTRASAGVGAAPAGAGAGAGAKGTPVDGARAGAGAKGTPAARTGAGGAPAPRARWTAVCRAVRAWAVAHPHEYALIYGSPVPGYSAPQATVAPASRVAHVLLAVLRDAHRSEGVAPPPLAEGLRAEADRLTADLAPDLPPALAVAFVNAWCQLFGLISFEVFGHFAGVVEEAETFFTHSADRLGHELGLLR
ncbi:TetR family transcriptional regulator [Streptomyces sp. WAC05374]|uniref:TetR/AcrR family transcriptional regulator n=1 Tax=Streptomyces sp. WAC05374 TaxID=2487420 RepID=UPI000F877EDF|nr:TetR/AcrR family transcriptional regulator [Streptomyces sp. WAC05374]RST18930.1 TetR family transcriptional regulator [Streptomyces sp. WAC05374]TDF50615.1 TetR family transcriptional regulator [Streptomyces sp. WAC05374]TDF56905.1 TetR family transcriptional regulator [Streptomyces sp. WAC05374]TDF60868.1 TetR family transcriptional regulator [Streptomyces sp. WAC05374]